ncbi:putative RDD family membrane protein YckC [Mumia flava]|uniref:Putative RDD family membrane protein YckC n=1 Tax=Mumia flava TaxID=1348852 RepID=A0A2M9BDF1_9ACTN|nr:RDD family protein [Mumia flava]PJJ55990.1 putative RDD family membrane protein YckC [Mumia flava]
MSHQQEPPYGEQPYGQPAPPGTGYTTPDYVPPSPYAGWWSRVGAYLIDGLIGAVIALIPAVVGGVLLAAGGGTDAEGDVENGGLVALGIVLLVLAWLLALLFQLWNQGIRQGSRGQSIGKGVLGIRVIEMATGQPLGAGRGVLRWILLVVLYGLCFLDVLWPLWDKKKQTWHDMIVGSVVVRA